ncbi:mavicyanin-like [Papaver somniferum]|uniref:mavicyanin-like n=1 Tax=Papaver somniferum TaxID=3469 RepID=UPI000E6FF9E5|nr:mavicyanin-like [Papaver somniferum]
MGFNSKFLFSLIVLAVVVPLMGNAFVWNVGDDAGWSGQAQYDYHYWALGTMFLVGDDSLRFVYDPNATNVMEVSYCDFKSCNPSSPLATYNTGNDTLPITKLHQYFISGNPVDCNNGLKVDITAYNTSYYRFWRSGPEYGPDGYVNVPNFDNDTGTLTFPETMSCDSS